MYVTYWIIKGTPSRGRGVAQYFPYEVFLRRSLPQTERR